ncbi:restriction endonuclease subunit S [Aeromonas veronii]
MAEQMMQHKAGDVAAKQTIPAGYKQTEVGVIPEDWVVRKLVNIGQFKNGINKSAEDFGFGSPFVNLMDVFGKPVIKGNEVFGLINSTPLDKKEYSLIEGDVLFIRSSVKPSGVGQTTVVTVDLKDTVYSGFLIRFRSDKQLNTNFKKHCFYEELFRGRVIASSTISANTNINQDALKDICIAFPASLIEQTAIANVLSDTDALIVGLEQLIAKKQAIKTATMQQLLTGRTRLPQFALRPDGTPKGYKSSELGQIPEDWESVDFGNIAKPSASRINPKMSGGGDVCIELEHLSSGTGTLLGETTTNRTSSLKSIFEPGDVLFGKLRAYLKKYILADFNGVCSTEVWVLKPDVNLATSEYIYSIVQSERFINAASEAYGTHMPRADWSVVKYFPVMLPSTVEQTAIATILSDMDSELTALQQKLAKARSLKQGMMQQLLTGRIRLPLPQEA